MAMVNITEACKLVGVTRTTFYKYLKAGKISLSKDGRDRPVVDTVELLRVFGSFKADKGVHSDIDDNVREVTVNNDSEINALKAEIQVLNERLKAKEELLEERGQRITEMRESLKLIENMSHKKRRLWPF